MDALKFLKSNTQQLTIKDKIPEDQLNEEAKNETEKIRKLRKWLVNKI